MTGASNGDGGEPIEYALHRLVAGRVKVSLNHEAGIMPHRRIGSHQQAERPSTTGS
jgi:hypothetical protein